MSIYESTQGPKKIRSIQLFVLIHFLLIVLSTNVTILMIAGTFFLINMIYMPIIRSNVYTILKVLINCKSLGTFDVNFYFNLQEKKESIPGV